MPSCRERLVVAAVLLCLRLAAVAVVPLSGWGPGARSDPAQSLAVASLAVGSDLAEDPAVGSVVAVVDWGLAADSGPAAVAVW